ncbi:MAG: helix-turn-helix transcriptional regulator, partial [Candidatus Diapherotrites archaeon]|nr:helix-turn-helix transcriptional regulator [Candidatus Diapherotrites archaeon]
AKKPMSVEELSKKLNAERSRVSHSLQVLKTCSYVETEKQGKQRIYSLKKDVLEGMKRENPSNLFGFVDQHFESYCNCECRKTL